MREVKIDPMSLERLAGLLDPDRAKLLVDGAELAKDILRDRVVWNVNATATGGGVAEMLTTLLAYSRGAEVDARWVVLDGNAEFFRITKRLHNLLHGSVGDGGGLGDAEREVYDAVLTDNAAWMQEHVSKGDIVLLHDPQTAGLVDGLHEAGAHVVWRCHIGKDDTTPETDRAWEFLRPYLQAADAVIFSREAYVPEWVDHDWLRIIPPSLDPFSTKNVELREADVRAALRCAGLVDLADEGGGVEFERRDGTRGSVRAHDDVFAAGGIIPGDARLVMQVSRWDRLKDMSGVLEGFVAALPAMADDVHLALVGPEVSGVSDDPEGAEVLEECTAIWQKLPDETRERVHLVALPMDDVDENAHLVNALQHHATVVVQKSLVEGFGLTVTEPMWKGKPVIASAVGGIQDQIVDGTSGLLLADPQDLEGFGELLARVLDDAAMAHELGVQARERVREMFLGDRHLLQYVTLFAELLERRA
jgi:trehalose synthase